MTFQEIPNLNDFRSSSISSWFFPRKQLTPPEYSAPYGNIQQPGPFSEGTCIGAH